MATRLRLKRLDEISFVDKGASGDGTDSARIVFAKRHDPQPIKETTDTKTESGFMASIIAKLFGKAEGEGEKSADQMLQEFMAQLPEEQQKTLMLIIQALGAKPDPEPTAETEKKEDEDPEVAKVRKAADARDAERLARIEKLERHIEQEEAQALAKSMPYLGGSTEENAAGLLAIKKVATPEGRAFLERVFGRVEALAKSALVEKGSARESLVAPGQDPFDARATEIMKRSNEAGNPVTYAKAYKMAVAEPEAN